LLHLVTLSPDPARTPDGDYAIVRSELQTYGADLAGRPEIVALSQADLPEVREAWPALRETFRQRFGVELFLVSAATRYQLGELLEEIWKRLPPRTSSAPAAEHE
jgi:GTP-binding protein